MLTLGTAKLRLQNYSDAGRLIDRINLACELLLTGQNHKGSLERVAFTTSTGMITLPRQYYGCLGSTVNQWPRPIYNHWYEFVAGGPGESERAFESVLDLGDNYCSFIDVLTVNEDGSQIKVVSELAEDNGQQILLRGLDTSLETVWTTHEGERLEGEYIDLATGAGATSVSTFSSLKSVVKPITKGKVYIYVGSTLIATYDPAEERPAYRRYRVPSCDEEEVDIVALCQRRFVDVRDENDPLPVENINALIYAMMALNYRDQNDLERHDEYLNKAKQVLSDEKNRANPAHTYPPMVHTPGYANIPSLF